MPIELDEQFFRKLDRFEVVPHGVHRGGQIGPRRSPSRGTGLEFADHKEYSPGDDIRYIDWNVYAHLEELFVKVFEQEETLPVYVLLDVSASMSVGSPSKLELAAKLAAALSYVALANQDAARVILFADGVVRSTKVLRGKARIYDILQLLDAKAEGTTSLSAALETFSAETHLPGVALILSDFLDPEECWPGRACWRDGGLRCTPCIWSIRASSIRPSPAMWRSRMWRPESGSNFRCDEIRWSDLRHSSRITARRCAMSYPATASATCGFRHRWIWMKYSLPDSLKKVSCDKGLLKATEVYSRR